MIFFRQKAIESQVKSQVEGLVAKKLDEVISVFKEREALEAQRDALRKQVADLEIERDKRLEEFGRKEREIQHMVGLHKTRMEHEKETAKTEALLQVREENLKASEDRFKQQLDFHEKRFSQEVGYLKDLLVQIMGRIPDVSAVFRGGNAPSQRILAKGGKNGK